jgi:hypothetical protein
MPTGRGYEEEGVMKIPDRDELYRHTDRNTLTKLGEPVPNPLAHAAAGGPHAGDGPCGLGIGSLRDRP